ncbi:MAG TPA: copper amine oxidase N-terminal domain-containing protein, partial [Candidatus Nitrosocosmicus sp.]|nr:copper amine oxidase N-terminal domain-containing protein [Candidatus Nitrosocosmicus sp.]
RDIFIFVDGYELRPDVPAQIINGRTMVPIRFVAEALEAEVSWDDPSSTITINSNISHEKYQYNQWIQLQIDTLAELIKLGNENKDVNSYAYIRSLRNQIKAYDDLIELSMYVRPPKDKNTYFNKVMQAIQLERASVQLMLRAAEEYQLGKNQELVYILLDESSKLYDQSKEIREEANKLIQ